MSGGIRRRDYIISAAAKNGKVVVLSVGNGLAGFGRQAEIKAETLAETYAGYPEAVVNLSSQDASLGRGVVLAMKSLSKNRLVTSSNTDNPSVDLPPEASIGPFRVSGVETNASRLRQLLGGQTNASTAASRSLVENSSDGEIPVMLVSGSKSDATRLAQAEPSIKLIAYTDDGTPPSSPVMIGSTALVSPGSRGKELVRLTFRGTVLTGYEVIDLNPTVPNGEHGSKLFKNYLNRVDRENLVDKTPRLAGQPVLGNSKCISCHQAEGKKWRQTAHAHALDTLDKVGQGRDPECVSCHTVRFDWKTGFQSRQKTPQMAFVGCESCHSGGGKHSSDPTRYKMPRLGQKVCVTCHTPDQSPKYNFLTYWPQIKH